MSEHLRRTWILLDTLLDYLPGPQTMRSAASDDAPSETRSRVYTATEIDRQLAHLEHQARLRKGDYSRAGGDALERARCDQYRNGDYAVLDLAMMELEVVNATWANLAWRVAHHHPAVLDQALRVELVRTVQWLAARLPEPVRVPAWALPSTPPTAAVLLALRDMGVPFSVLARVYGADAVQLRKRARKAKEVA